jgi:hypothetical protein
MGHYLVRFGEHCSKSFGNFLNRLLSEQRVNDKYEIYISISENLSESSLFLSGSARPFFCETEKLTYRPLGSRPRNKCAGIDPRAISGPRPFGGPCEAKEVSLGTIHKVLRTSSYLRSRASGGHRDAVRGEGAPGEKRGT